MTADMKAETAAESRADPGLAAEPDAVIIRDLTLNCILGILPEERVAPQRVICSAELYTDLSRALTHDDITETLNYARAAEIISAVAGAAEAGTAEYLAGRIIAALREEFGSRLQGIQLEIRKPDILPGTTVAGVRIKRMFRGGND